MRVSDAGCVNLGDGVLERLALDIFLDHPVLDLPLQADELALLERLGGVGEIAPGVDAVPFGAGFVFALVVFPDLVGGDDEDGVVLLVLRGLTTRERSTTTTAMPPRLDTWIGLSSPIRSAVMTERR